MTSATRQEFIEHMKAKAALLTMVYDENDHSFYVLHGGGTTTSIDADTLEPLYDPRIRYTRLENDEEHIERLQRVADGTIGWKGTPHETPLPDNREDA